MKITKSQLRNIIKEEVKRLMEDPFADLDAAVSHSRSQRAKKPSMPGRVRDRARRGFADIDTTRKELSRAKAAGDSGYPANEAEARAAFKKMNSVRDPFKQMDVARRLGFVEQKGGVVTFKKKGGGVVRFRG